MRGPREQRGGAQGAGVGGSGRAPGPRVRRAIPSGEGGGGGGGCLLPARGWRDGKLRSGRRGRLPVRRRRAGPRQRRAGPREPTEGKRGRRRAPPRRGQRAPPRVAGAPPAPSPGPARPLRLPPAAAPPLKPVPQPQAAPQPCREGGKLALRCVLESPLTRVPLAAARGRSGVRPRKPLRKEGLRPGWSRGNNGRCCLLPSARGHAVSAAVRSSPGMPLTAAASGSRGLSLPGLPLLAARERRGTGGALTGCGRELLKLERPQEGKEEETEGHLAGSCLPLQARETLPLWAWEDPSS